MPNAPKTPLRQIRVDHDLWAEYGEACAAAGLNRSDDLRAHMKRKVSAWRRKAKTESPT
jgi:hypothetical protein